MEIPTWKLCKKRLDMFNKIDSTFTYSCICDCCGSFTLSEKRFLNGYILQDVTGKRKGMYVGVNINEEELKQRIKNENFDENAFESLQLDNNSDTVSFAWRNA